MKQPETPASSIERLFTLTLLVDEAISSDRTEELAPLLSERQSTLDLLSRMQLSVADQRELDKTRALESQVIERLVQVQGSSLNSIQDFTKTRSALASYRSNSTSP